MELGRSPGGLSYIADLSSIHQSASLQPRYSHIYVRPTLPSRLSILYAASSIMENPVRPDEQAARNTYARGYRTWSRLFHVASSKTDLPGNCLRRLRTAFPNIPHLPNDIQIINSFTNVALAKGITTWLPATEPGHLQPFQDEVLLNLA
jgi:hypothetical protein